MAIKFIFDFILSLLLLILLTPLIIVLLIILFFTLKGNPVFKQMRPGLNGEIFCIYKLRTMSNERNISGTLLPDSERLTKIGRIVRSLSLDELLQLFNVLKGEMSFVGPRPLLPEYLSLYNDEQQRRHLVRPGITGWAQVNGRNAISWEHKFKLDIWYVENQSLLLDFKILYLTVLKVIKRDGISASNSVTIEKFKGN